MEYFGVSSTFYSATKSRYGQRHVKVTIAKLGCHLVYWHFKTPFKLPKLAVQAPTEIDETSKNFRVPKEPSIEADCISTKSNRYVARMTQNVNIRTNDER